VTAIVVVLVATGFRPQNVFALTYGFVYLSVIQSVLSSDPFYYVLLLFYQGLSPLLFLVLIVGVVYLWKHKKGKDSLLVWMVLSFLVVTMLQGRSSVRHLVVIVPFAVMLVARTVVVLLPQKKKIISGVIVALVVFYPTMWTVSAISDNLDYTPWSELGEFTNSLPPDATIKYAFPYHSLATTTGTGGFESHYSNRNVEIIKSVSELADGDYYVLADFSEGSSLLHSEPLRTDIYFLGYPVYMIQRDVPFPALEEFVKSEGKLVETFYCDGNPCVWLYHLPEVEGLVEEEYSFFANADKKDDFFKFFCEKLDGGSVLNMLPNRLKGQIERKCVSLG
jgi:hypothetical protein